MITQTVTRCPELRRACCGKPTMCGLTGAEVDEETCARCENRPERGATLARLHDPPGQRTQGEELSVVIKVDGSRDFVGAANGG